MCGAGGKWGWWREDGDWVQFADTGSCRGLPALGQMLLVAGASPGSYTTPQDRPAGVVSVDAFPSLCLFCQD